MSFDNTPNALESAHVQRDKTNSYYEQVNISGSDLIIYHDASGSLTADKVSVWATKYGIGSGGSSVSSSWASSSISASYAATASFALNGGGGGGTQVSCSWASSSLSASVSTSASYAQTASFALNGGGGSSGPVTQSIYSTQSLYATQSISASFATTASYVNASNVVGTVTSASYATTSSYAVMWDSSSLISYIEDLLQSTTYYLTATSSVNGYYEMRSTGSSVNTNTLTTSSIPTGGYVFSWITDPAEPHTTVLASGIYQPDFYASIDNPSGTTTLTPELYLTDASGNIYYELPAGGISNPLTTTFARYTLNVIVDFPITMSATDRLLFKLKCNTTAVSKGFNVEVEGDVLSHLATPLAQISTNVESASYALFAGSSISSSYAITASYVVIAANATSADFALLAGEAITADFAVIAGNTLYTSSYALTASIALNATPFVSSSWASSSLSSSYASTASFALNAAGGNANTASSIYVTGSALSIINTTNYFVGTSLCLVTTASYLTALTLTMMPNTTAYVKMTLHGADAIYGPAFFMGEYVLQKDYVVSYGQPGNIISQYNQNSNVYVQSFIPDVLYTTGSSVLAIQLKTLSGSFTGSLVYEIRGQFTAVNQPYTASTTSSFGDTFESYPVGPISVLYALSPVYASDGVVKDSTWGIMAAEFVGAYPSGSAPALNAGSGWVSVGTIS